MTWRNRACELKKLEHAVATRVSKLAEHNRVQALSEWEDLASTWESWLANSFIALENAKNSIRDTAATGDLHNSTQTW